MIETIRRIESPNPPQCDFCEEPAAVAYRRKHTLTPIDMTFMFCEQCWEKRRQSKQEKDND